MRRVAIIVSMLVLTANADAGVTRLPPEYQARYDAVEACLDAHVKEPKISFQRSEFRDGRWCLASWEKCYSGLTAAPDRQIILTDEDTTAMEHESVHHILYWIGDPGWKDHSHPAFAECGVPYGTR